MPDPFRLPSALADRVHLDWGTVVDLSPLSLAILSGVLTLSAEGLIHDA